MRCLIISILNSFTAFDVNWNAQLFNSTTENDKVNVEIALKNGVKPSATDQYGYTTLMLPASKGNQELAELLIEKGANINAKNTYHCTALDKAMTGVHVAELIE